MSELFHRPRTSTRRPKRRSVTPSANRKKPSAAPTRAAVTVRKLIESGARQLRRAGVFFGHGTDNAFDESAALVFHALNLAHHAGVREYSKPVSVARQRAVQELLSRRIDTRVPAVYLTGETWFAGLPFFVDSRVLVPRSPLAELIEQQFMPWIDPRQVRHVLDLGTGSGCIAIASAVALPRARVDAVDISDDALEVARINVGRHKLKRRVRVLKSDHFSALGRQTYDIIVTNPPYVGQRELKGLPAEYRHEPRIALAAGRDGLDSVRIILREAARHLRPRGLLVVEVGNTETTVRRAFRRLPFVWLDFERGGGGVFLLTAEQLRAGEPN